MAGAALQAVLDDEGPPGEPARDPVHELGLSVVRRLSKLLAHPVRFRPQTGRGPAFAIEVGAAAEPPAPAEAPARPTGEEGVAEATRAGIVLVVEDDSEMRALLELLLKGQGYRVETAPDGVAALAMVERADVRPDLVLVDYDLPGGVDGLHVATRIRALSHKRIPVIVLTGDVSLETLRAIARQDCAHLDKPVKASDLDKAVARLLAGAPGLQEARPPQAEAAQGASPVIFVVDDDSRIREGVRALLEDEGRIVEDFPTGEAFLEAWRPGRESCLLIDAGLPGMSGLDLLKRLREAGDGPPAIMITGNSDVPMAVAAMKAGALDFIEKPIGAPELLASVERALERARDSGSMAAWRENAAAQLSELTAREREIMDLVVAGHPSKNIAADLGISQRTVENHRAAIMKKTGSTSLPALARLALAAAWKRAGPPG
jgi:two-component system CheB/CheR fusion protein